MSTKISKKRLWAAIIIFGLFGQFAWMIENMYFNLFVYNTITANPTVIANMVSASAITATVTTLLMGALSDKWGKRKAFIVVGYILWGISTAAFSLISLKNVSDLFGVANAVTITSIAVIIMDCVMTFFGSTANDAAFNAWVTDVTDNTERGRVEGVLAILPLVAMLIIFGGFDGMTQAGNWSTFFLIFGGLVTLGGVVGIFLIDDNKDLKPSKENYKENLLYGFLPQTIKDNKKLYITLIALGINGIATQVYMPYLIIYIQNYLAMDNYTIVLAVVLIVSSIISVVAGLYIDKIGKSKSALFAIVIYTMGLIIMYFVSDFIGVIIGGIVMMGSSMVVGACINGLLRDYTPISKAGQFQGIRIIFAVLLPMVTGPYIGAYVIRNSGAFYEDLGVLKPVPTPAIFLVSAVIAILILIPIFVLRKKENLKNN